MSTNLKTFFQDLQNRGLIANSANLENFYQLKSNEKVVYLGIDCTANSLHIGHLFLLLQTVRFAKEGFTVLLVLGGATSKIGDPSDKLKERPQLETEKLKRYRQRISFQLDRIVKKRKIESFKFTSAPLEQFYSDNQVLLNDIYKILKINKGDENKKK